MAIQQFELFHGAVLAKLMRNNRPVTLRLIETNADAWSVYTINDAVDLFIKIRTKGSVREDGGMSWQFSFTPEEIRRIDNLRAIREVALALVCGQRNVEEKMRIAFIEPHIVANVLNFTSGGSQSLTIRYKSNCNLRIITNYREDKKIPQNALDKWDVPGS